MKSIQSVLLKKTMPLRYGINSYIFKRYCDVSRLESLRDIYKGQPMIVVGNGPSLNETPLDDFVNIPAIGMNKIDKIFNRTSWRPEIIVCLNNVVAVQQQAVYSNIDIPVFVAWKSRKLLKEKFRGGLGYYNLSSSNSFSGDPIEGFGNSATVTYIALQFAFWMGANPVVLFGVDHSFEYSGPNSTYQIRTGEDVNHFDKNYFEPGTYWATPDLEQSELEYQFARDFFETRGRTIFDASLGGKLNVFPKIDLGYAREVLSIA